MKVSQSPTTKAYLFLTLTTLCWGANTVFAKLAVDQISPMMLIMWRWLGVVIIALALAYPKVRQEWSTLRGHFGYLAAMGALGFSAFNALFYTAAHKTSALNMGIVQGTIPVFVIIGVFIVYRSKVTLPQLLGIMVTLAGVLLVAAEGQLARLTTLSFNSGDLMIVLACSLYAGYTVWLREKPQVSALVWFTMLAIAAFVASVPAAAFEWALGEGQWPTSQGWMLLGAIVIFPSFVAQIAFIRGVELIGPSRSGVFVNLVPIIASIAAVVVLGESFQWFHGIALVLVLSGIAIAEKWAANDNPLPTTTS